jgi:uncharacterized protein (TIGR03032 family)
MAETANGTVGARPVDRWAENDAAWRDPEEVVAGYLRSSSIDRRLLESRTRGDWWAVLDRLDACVIVSREYEHLLLALTVAPEGPRQSFMSLPHPSGLAFDARTERLHVASTRNPNQIFVLAPTDGMGTNGDSTALGDRPLAPLSASFLPGRLYLHDLALIGGALYGNAVGLNCVVRLAGPGERGVAWWPRAVERDARPDTSHNYLQLNSIAAGGDLSSSFFSASADKPSRRRPGHRNFPVDRRGVIFSGATREPVVRGLTRPHSARLHGEELWVDDSGYGRLVKVQQGEPVTVARLPGWTRGLAFAEGVAFVGTSRVIPRFAHYAPGLDVDRSTCAVHALDVRTGEVLGSIQWPGGDQVFAIAVLPRTTTLGFPALAGRRQNRRELNSFYYSFHLSNLTGAS